MTLMLRTLTRRCVRVLANECSGAVVSVFTGGAFFGAMFAGYAGDRLGRKWTIMIGALIFILGGSLQTAADHINYLYAGRCLAGLGYVSSQFHKFTCS